MRNPFIPHGVPWSAVTCATGCHVLRVGSALLGRCPSVDSRARLPVNIKFDKYLINKDSKQKIIDYDEKEVGENAERPARSPGMRWDQSVSRRTVNLYYLILALMITRPAAFPAGRHLLRQARDGGRRSRRSCHPWTTTATSCCGSWWRTLRQSMASSSCPSRVAGKGGFRCASCPRGEGGYWGAKAMQS